MINYGILCTASIAKRYIDGIRESKDGYVYGVASRSLENAKAHAEKNEIDHYYGSYEDMITDPNIDVIYIPLMNEIHYKYAKLSLQNKKHVVVEKPFVLFSKDAQDLFQVANENNVFLMEAQKSVFLPTTLKLKELLKSGYIGKVQYIELRASFKSRFTPDHWMNNIKLGGGALYGSATYTIEFLQFLFDEIKMEHQGLFLQGPGTADDIVNFQLKFKDMLVNSTISMCSNLRNEAVFYGSEGYIVVPNYWKSNHMLIFKENGEQERLDFPYNSEFVYEVNHINECIQKGLLTSPVMTPEKTIATIEIVEDLYSTYNK